MLLLFWWKSLVQFTEVDLGINNWATIQLPLTQVVLKWLWNNRSIKRKLINLIMDSCGTHNLLLQCLASELWIYKELLLLQMWHLYSFFFISSSVSISCWEHPPIHAHMHACEKHAHSSSSVMKHFPGGLVTEEVSCRSFSHFSFLWKLVLRTLHPLWMKLKWLEWMKTLNGTS